MKRWPLPTWQVAWLLIRLRLRRLVNLLGAPGRRQQRRGGTRPRRRGPVLLTVVVLPVMALAYVHLAHQVVDQLDTLVADPEAGARLAFGSALLQVLAVELAVLALAGVLTSLGSRELAQADGDLEWLVTLPAETGTLLWARIAERSVANAFGLLALWPACSVLAWWAGAGLAAAALGLLAALPLLALMAMAWTLVDTGLRLHLAPSRLRNLQAGSSVAGIVVFCLAISPGLPAGGQWLLQVAQVVPAWIRWTPPGLVLQAMGAPSAAQALGHVALLLAEVAALLAAGMALLRRLLAQGVAGTAVRETGRRPPGAAGRPGPPAARRWAGVSPVQWRELMLLARDRNFLVQATVLPVVLVGLQWVMNRRADALAQVWADPQMLAAGVFSVAAYALVLSAFQTLTAEGGALWLLYTFPRPVEAVLRDRARLWSVLALAYPALGFAGLLAFGPPLEPATLGLFGMVALGIPIHATIAVALGVFACNPLASDPRQRVRPTYLCLYMLLAGLYTAALYAPHWWQSLVFIVLSVLLALALWQKARDQLPCLLDPVASPPARVSTADGLIAAMLFFVLQMGISAWWWWRGQPVQGPPLLFSFALAGALTWGAVRFVHWRARLREVPAVWGAGWARALATGLVVGAAAGAVGITSLQAVRALGLVDDTGQAPSAAAPPLAGWLLVLALLAAPLFEEYIFRGLVFGGLRRSMRLLPAALASAAIFAIVHPPLSMLPVFVLGLGTAWAFERTRLLIAPMVAHAVYNAALIGWPVWGLAGRV